MLIITDTLIIPMREIHFSFIRASGPGGQHVNRSATAVQLRFDARNSPSLSVEIKNRLCRLAGSRLSKDDMLTIEAQEYRSQKRNRDEALHRLARLLRLAAMRPKARRPTKPSTAAKQRRLAAKKRRSLTKQIRGSHGTEE
jgi:ribosome-associated protein